MSILFNSTTLGDIIIVTGSVILLLVLTRVFAWNQITGIFEARAEKIANDIDSAESARKEAEEYAAKREKELSQAKDDAGEIIESAKETGQAKGDQIIAEAKAEALAGVKGEVSDLTVLLAEKIMTKNLDKEAQSHLIDSYLDKLGDA